MFNKNRKASLARFLELHGFQKVDQDIYVRPYDFAGRPASIEVNFKRKIEIKRTSSSRSHVEQWGWSSLDTAKVIIGNEAKVFENFQAMYNSAGTAV